MHFDVQMLHWEVDPGSDVVYLLLLLQQEESVCVCVCADVCGCVGLTRQSVQDRAATDVQSLVPLIIIITRCLCDRIHAQMRQFLKCTSVCVYLSVNMCRGISECFLCIY